MTTQKIIYTVIDEAPALATYSLLPILQAYTKGSGISFAKRISLFQGELLQIFLKT